MKNPSKKGLELKSILYWRLKYPVKWWPPREIFVPINWGQADGNFLIFGSLAFNSSD